jgi:hypothetical protein
MPVSDSPFANLLYNSLTTTIQPGVFGFFWNQATGTSEAASIPRLYKLEHDFRTFNSTLQALYRLGRPSIPAVEVGESLLPSNLASEWLIYSRDTTALNLRKLWSIWLRREAGTDFVLEGGAVSTMPINVAARVFADGMSSAVYAAISTGTQVIDFEVNSKQSGYRVHSTEQYWYSPVAFGSSDSTPVVASRAPAKYRFGGDTGGSILWDYGTHEVSDTNTSTMLTRF